MDAIARLHIHFAKSILLAFLLACESGLVVTSFQMIVNHMTG